MNTPKITMVIPTYNMAVFLRECLDSVLGQSETDFEAIIIDDGSVDDTTQVMADYLPGGAKSDSRIQFIRQENAGKLVALNRGLSLARGDFFCILDADDCLPPESLKARVLALEDDPQAVAVYADAQYMDKAGNPYRIRRSRPVQSRKELVGSFIVPIIGTTLMVRTKVMFDIHPLDTSYVRSDDAYISMEVYSQGKVIYLPEVVLQYRTYRRSAALKLRLTSVYHLCRIIHRYYSGIRGYYLMALQIIYAALKFAYEILSPKK